MALRVHRVSAAQWAHLAATRLEGAPPRPVVIDLGAIEAEEDLARRMRTEHAQIQAYIDALATN